jgi:hypothetical protein
MRKLIGSARYPADYVTSILRFLALPIYSCELRWNVVRGAVPLPGVISDKVLVSIRIVFERGSTTIQNYGNAESPAANILSSRTRPQTMLARR